MRHLQTELLLAGQDRLELVGLADSLLRVHMLADLLLQNLLAKLVLVHEVAELVHRHEVALPVLTHALGGGLPNQAVVDDFLKAHHLELRQHVQAQFLRSQPQFRFSLEAPQQAGRLGPAHLP